MRRAHTPLTRLLLLLWSLCAAATDALDGPAACTLRPLSQKCNGNNECHPDNTNCPPVTTDVTCGEVPHSGRDGKVLTWGLSYKTTSAQQCCDRCKSHTHCNSWTFCGLPVCWGLDTGHNHTCTRRVCSNAGHCSALRPLSNSSDVRRAWCAAQTASAGCGGSTQPSCTQTVPSASAANTPTSG